VAKYRYTTDIYIHTNANLTAGAFNKNKNGYVYIITHDLTGENPYKLAWKCRDLLYKQRDEYDIFMYIEDDILVPTAAIEYWIAYKDKLLRNGFNLGFARIEVDEKGDEFVSDFIGKLGNYLVGIENEMYVINNQFPYCAFWIYDKQEFRKWTESEFYDPAKILGYDIREMSAVGLHGLCTYWYKTTVYPYVNYNIHRDSRIYHLANTYVGNKNLPNAKVPFNYCINYS
jgi:hypothetical protein